jgi:hypothetical protein
MKYKKIIIILLSVASLFAAVYAFIPAELETLETPQGKELFVYETEAYSSEDCSSYEEYDAEAGVCYFECETEAECNEIDNKIESELSTWLDDTSGASKEPADLEQSTSDSVDAEYRVTKGEVIQLTSGSDSQTYQDIWYAIAALSPNTLSDTYIDTFTVYSDQNSDSVAYVTDEEGDGTWQVAINLPTYNEVELSEKKTTLVHELAHIISLNSSQVKPANSCKALLLDEGCAKEDSYINVFNEKFWKNIKNPKYSSEKFVTEYATTDVTEDFAESFSYFVLGKGKESLGASVRDQKVSLFYSYPELVTIRSSMRAELARDIVRERKTR